MRGLLKVLFDVDGVLADFTLAFTSLAKELGIIKHSWKQSEQITWDLPFHVDPVWREVNQRMNWWMTLEPLIGIEEIDLINRAIYEHEVFFITNRHDPDRGLSVEAQTMHWLDSVGVDVGSAEVFRTDDKAKLATNLHLDLGIDDNLANLLNLSKVPGFTPVALTWPYNKDFTGCRVSSVSQFISSYLDL